MKSWVGLLSVGLLAWSLPVCLIGAELSPREPSARPAKQTSASTPSLWESVRRAAKSLAGPAEAQPPETAPKPDPTKAGPMLRSLLDRSKNGQVDPLPTISVRARVLNSHLPPAALLDIGGQLHLVRQGDDFSLPKSNYTVRVIELDRRTVRLEVEPLKQVLTLD